MEHDHALHHPNTTHRPARRGPRYLGRAAARWRTRTSPPASPGRDRGPARGLLPRAALTAAAAAALLGPAVWAAGPAAAATNPAGTADPACLVVDTTSNQSYSGLQAAVNAAAAGDILFVKGTCDGNVYITKNLTITGQSDGTQKTATLNGQNSELMNGYQVTATLNKLDIKDGDGIFNEGTLTLNGSTVTDATAGYGAGIYNAGGTLTLNGSTVTGNTATWNGGGIYNHQNAFGGGALTLNDSTVTGNTAARGGGIANCGTATVTLTGSSTITGNTAQGTGGGIYNANGTLVNAIAPPAADANVFGNTPNDITANGDYNNCL
jgi:hypothetical protein